MANLSLRPRPSFRVVIVGAGLAGLMMGILLDRMNIPYLILERAPKVKPLGALMSLNGNILALFDQLGLLDDVMKISLLNHSSSIYNEKLEKLAEVGMDNYKGLSGYDYIVFSRPELYEIIRQRVPEDKVLMNKRVSVIKQLPGGGGVEVICQDNTVYKADILVGADGAYSTIRHHMYKRMTKAGILPAVDAEDMAMPYICMVGTTTPLDDTEKYPELKSDHSQIKHVIGDQGPYSWTVIPITGNRFCWSVMVQLTDPEEARQMRERNSEWSSEAAESMVDKCRSCPIAFGGKGAVLGDILDVTPKDVISKVMLEEKLFETWYNGNIVLIGDGAINAMQDATILANCLYDLEDLTSESIKQAFKDYKDQRFIQAKKQVANSQLNAKISSGQTLKEKVIRSVVLNLLPKWVHVLQFTKSAAYRPQTTFMPMIPDKGSVASLPQKPSKRYQAELQQKRQQQQE
ncbi:hypothetical protein BGZ95_005751 [Linnemannia exigua]|uniref:FAD-binding domain-containing protein n=1 Tax=Linnemannia exigua TaxID=604196 RepID=A0AAD4DGP5_9FUNG|nr:hypothetical protein BGZ95_005751 [Linnemannia exigua]